MLYLQYTDIQSIYSNDYLPHYYCIHTGVPPTGSLSSTGTHPLSPGCRHCYICPGTDASQWFNGCPTLDINPVDVQCPVCVCESNGLDKRRCNSDITTVYS